MRLLLPSLLAFSIFTTLSSLLAQEPPGKLQTVRDEVRGDKKDVLPPAGPAQPPPDDAEKKQELPRQYCPDPSVEEPELPLGFCLLVLASPWLLPHACLGDDFGDRSFFRPYPYAGGRPGFMWIDHYRDSSRNEFITEPEGHTFKLWLARFTLDESSDFRGLERTHGQVLLDTHTRWGIQSDWSWLRERQWCGCYDQLWLGDINLVHRFAQSESVQMRSGVGLRMLFDRHDTHFGFNFTYGGDFFPVDPFVASFVFDAGTVGDAALFHFRGTIGVTYHRWEVFTGFDWLRIGRVDMTGPLIGARLWF